MILPEHSIAAITATFGLVCGVPDSSLAFLAGLWQENRSVVCTNEGSAIALAAGWAMSGTDRCPLVYLQNSGLTNALNPLLTLTHRSVHSVPMVMIIGMRGWPGDEPQHEVMGGATTVILEAASIPFVTITADQWLDLAQELRRSRLHAAEIRSPVAVPIKRNPMRIAAANIGHGGRSDAKWTSREATHILLESAPENAIIVSSTGYNTRYVYEFLQKNPDSTHDYVYNVGAMGHASSLAQGIALTDSGKRVICLDGDGSALMHLGALIMPTELHIKNYTHVILNNGSHESVGGGDTVGIRQSFAEIARACKLAARSFCGPVDESTRLALRELLTAPEPVLIEMLTRPDFLRPSGRPKPPFTRISH